MVAGARASRRRTIVVNLSEWNPAAVEADTITGIVMSMAGLGMIEATGRRAVVVAVVAIADRAGIAGLGDLDQDLDLVRDRARVPWRFKARRAGDGPPFCFARIIPPLKR